MLAEGKVKKWSIDGIMILFFEGLDNNFVYLIATDWQQNEYIYRFDLLLNPSLTFSSRYKMGKYKYLHNKLHLRRRKVRRNVFFMCRVIRLNQEYQINKRQTWKAENTAEKRKKIQFRMPQGVVEGLKGIKLEEHFVESIKKECKTKTKIFKVNF